MVQIGKFQTLPVGRLVPFGAYLTTDTPGEEILLPNNQLPPDVKVGDALEVFIYRDSEDRLIATQKKPFAQVGDIAALKVVETTEVGAFLDWGLEKDLFLPFREQKYRIHAGKRCVVAVYLDKKDRLCATMDIEDRLRADSPYQKDDLVQGSVYAVKEDFGAFVAVENLYAGFIPKNEYFAPIHIGDQLELRVVMVRDDGRLTVSPRQLAYKQINDDADAILAALRQNDGKLPLNDDSHPGAIQRYLHVSKKAFKRAVGRLMKARLIEQTEWGMRLLPPSERPVEQRTAPYRPKMSRPRTFDRDEHAARDTRKPPHRAVRRFDLPEEGERESRRFEHSDRDRAPRPFRTQRTEGDAAERDARKPYRESRRFEHSDRDRAPRPFRTQRAEGEGEERETRKPYRESRRFEHSDRDRAPRPFRTQRAEGEGEERETRKPYRESRRFEHSDRDRAPRPFRTPRTEGESAERDTRKPYRESRRFEHSDRDRAPRPFRTQRTEGDAAERDTRKPYRESRRFEHSDRDRAPRPFRTQRAEGDAAERETRKPYRESRRFEHSDRDRADKSFRKPRPETSGEGEFHERTPFKRTERFGRRDRHERAEKP